MWRKLHFQDERLERGISNALAARVVKVHKDTGMVIPRDISLSYNSNWIFFGASTLCRDCFLWHQIMFTFFDNFVPEFCRLRCYKVVVKVRDFSEAFQFYTLMNASPCIKAEISPICGKVGIDERFYSSGHFNGFVYADGLEDALTKYRIVRELVDDHLSPDIPIIIKRTCTEFERKHGATDQPFWQAMPKEDLDFQRRLEDIFIERRSYTNQPDWLKNKVISKMVKWANTVGDRTWVEFVGKDNLTMQAVTYHHLAVKGDSENDTS
jgi:hypothetical protein